MAMWSCLNFSVLESLHHGTKACVHLSHFTLSIHPSQFPCLTVSTPWPQGLFCTATTLVSLHFIHQTIHASIQEHKNNRLVGWSLNCVKHHGMCCYEFCQGHTHTHTHTHTNKHTESQSDIHIHSDTHSDTSTTHAHAHTQHTVTHTYTATHTYSDTPTPTHTQ